MPMGTYICKFLKKITKIEQQKKKHFKISTKRNKIHPFERIKIKLKPKVANIFYCTMIVSATE